MCENEIEIHLMLQAYFILLMSVPVMKIIYGMFIRDRASKNQSCEHKLHQVIFC